MDTGPDSKQEEPFNGRKVELAPPLDLQNQVGSVSFAPKNPLAKPPMYSVMDEPDFSSLRDVRYQDQAETIYVRSSRRPSEHVNPVMNMMES